MLTATGLEARGGSIFQDTAKPEQIMNIIVPLKTFKNSERSASIMFSG